MVEHYLAPYIWQDNGTDPTGWYSKYPVLGLLDFRSNTDAAKINDVAGYAVFVTADTVTDPDWIHLGDKQNFTQSHRDELKNKLSLGENIISTSFPDVLWELFNQHGDATGSARWKPMMPKSNGYMELELGGHSIIKRSKIIANRSPEWNSVLSLIQENYRRANALYKGKPDRTDLKYLGGMALKFPGANTDDMIPAGLPKERSRRPTTTIIDDFNRANETPLATLWTELEGLSADFDLISNQVKYTGSTSTVFMQHDTALSGEDQYTEMDAAALPTPPTNTSSYSVMCRMRWVSQADRDYYYMALGRFTAGTFARNLNKYVAGVFTSLATDSGTINANDTHRVEANGSTVRALVNGTELHSVTDTSITGELRVGFEGRDDNTPEDMRLDNFKAADIFSGEGNRTRNKSPFGFNMWGYNR